MTSKSAYFLFPLIFLLLSLSSCDPYQKVLKSNDFDFKYAKAKEYYNQGDYFKAIPLLEELKAVYIGTKNVEKINYFYAYSHFGQGDYLLASYYFQSFVENYRKSPLVEDANYMVGYCFYKLSPKPTLEQTYTLKSIEFLQLFVNAYPYSEKVETANNLMDEMRTKLELKAFDGANLYYNIRSYKSSINAFRNLLKDFPETSRKEEVNFLILKSEFLLAQKSVEYKKQERFDQVVNSYYKFIDSFPESTFGKEAERIFDSARKNLEKLSSNE